MTRSNLSQELGITYYRTMSKFVQYRRNASKNNMSSIQANVLRNIVQDVLQ